MTQLDNIKTSFKQEKTVWGFLTKRIAPIIVVVYQLLALAGLVEAAVNASGFFRAPFIGAFVEHTLVLNARKPIRPETWNAQNQGLGFGYQLQSIEGIAIDSVNELNNLLRSYSVGDSIVIKVKSSDGTEKVENIFLQKFPVADRIAHMVVPYVISLVYLVSGLWVLNMRRYDTTGQVFSTFTASVAIGVAGLFEIGTTSQLTGLWTFSLAMAGGTMMHLALIFPGEMVWMQRKPFWGWLSYIPTIILTIIAYPTLFDFSRPYAYIQPWRYEYLFLGISVLFFLGVVIYQRYSSRSPIIKQQGQIILWGSVISFVPISIWFLITSNRPEISFSPYLLFPLMVFPLAVSYSILRYRFLNTDYLFSRGVLYALLSILAVAGYALLVSGISMVLGDRIPASNPYLIGLMIFILALLLNPIRIRLQGWIDTVFFRGQQVYREKVQAFSKELNPAMDLSTIVDLLREYVEQSLIPTQLHIFVLDTLRDHFHAVPDGKGKPTTDISFVVSSPLVQMLSEQSPFVFLGEDQEIPPTLVPDKTRIALLGARVFVPLPGRSSQIIGFMALASRRSGEPYTSLDLNLLTSLSDQAALAVERAQVVSDLERRVQEMNALIRVAQGINITLRFDDILELIFAQTNRIVPTKDFWVLLYDAFGDVFHYAFYLEDDRRLLQHENIPLMGEQDLAQIVIRTGQPIVSDDYERESRGRGIIPRVEGLFAWVGVPLNAGASTIGAISLGSRDPSTMFSSDQVDLLHAIADQAAGAIIKARLLEDSERSAKQLTLLNDVARNLTSTLDLQNLLNQILENAVEIIGCEAGTLFLVDAETEELIFEVVKGPVADELRGKRLPPGTGHVGRSVETGLPAIVNEARHTSEWSKKPDEQTGFKTRDLLLVPMYSKNRVIGVIEVINRKDGLPFTQENQDLLTAFTSQAAIALENARLYTMTDQQLADRVDELSVMQRIDRELNASLEINRAMRITLEWAMRRSGANAGLVGAVAEEGIHVMADQGYTSELDPYRESVLPIELPGLRNAVDSEQTQQYSRSHFDRELRRNGFSLLVDANSQIVIPIRREEQVIGILLLESQSDEPWVEGAQDFLSRLSDHAAIAISNAQLFTQVQEADMAKSEFVSFVSHELKTPMTSIRGYTDLLIGGAVGEINDAQENFLGTIRSNVVRMATLVSDLADVSRIEAGRLKLEFRAVDISDIVEEVFRSLAQDVKEKDQILEKEIPDGLPSVWGDRVRITQVLTNLMSNAHKYTPSNGTITIRADQGPNQWDPNGPPDIILVSVEDSGIGMSPEDQQQIFTKFFRSSDPKAREAPGTGLGLNITRYLVEMQGGKIWFESEHGEGTTFHFTIPIAEV